MSELKAGIGRAIITPPVGIPMAGFAGRGPAEGVNDELLATTLAVESGCARALVVTMDVIGTGDDYTAEIRSEIERATGVPAASVLLCSSHTHYNAELGADDPIAASYKAYLKFLLAGTARAAVADLQPVRIGVGEGQSFIGINRRERKPDGRIWLGNNPDGPCDRQVRVMRLDTTDGKPLAALVNFTCHPVSPADTGRLLSADWIGSMRKLVESFTGATCLFLQGAAGDINPIEMRRSDYEPARRLGVMLGGEVARIFESTATAPAEGLALSSERIELPGMGFDSIDQADRALAELEAALAKADPGDASGTWWAQNRLEKARKKHESLITGVPLPTIPAELTAIRIGNSAFVTCPGEIFNEIGVEVKRRSPVPHTCFVGYTNGSIGYVPVPSAYPEGGYEVESACRVGSAAAPMIAETAVSLLQKVV
jgi:hypothetical protein